MTEEDGMLSEAEMEELGKIHIKNEDSRDRLEAALQTLAGLLEPGALPSPSPFAGGVWGRERVQKLRDCLVLAESALRERPNQVAEKNLAFLRGWLEAKMQALGIDDEPTTDRIKKVGPEEL